MLLLGRRRGVGAIGGLTLSLLIMFTIPAILEGSNALVFALVTASAIAFAALLLADGFEVATTVAPVSTFTSLAITALLA